MKPLLSIATLLLCLTQFSYSQTNISIAEFLQLRGKTTNALESRLTSLNIQLYDQDEIGSGKTQFTYQNANTSEKSPFQWVNFVSAPNAEWNNRLSFQIQNIAQVKTYLTEMKNLGFKFTNKKIVDRQTYEVYTDGVNTIELITSQSRKVYDNNMYFNFAFYSNSEYEYAFANENKKFSMPQANDDNLFAALVDIK